MTLIFGYRHVVGVPLCPCKDPGNYLCCIQQEDNPLELHFTCWCGRTSKAIFDSLEERDTFLKANREIKQED